MLQGSTGISPGHVVLATGPHLILAPMSTDRASLLSAGDDGVVAPFGDRFFEPSCRLLYLRCYCTCTLIRLLLCIILAQQMPSGLKRRRHLGVTSGACKLSNESKPLLGLALGAGDSTEHPFLVTHSSRILHLCKLNPWTPSQLAFFARACAASAEFFFAILLFFSSSLWPLSRISLCLVASLGEACNAKRALRNKAGQGSRNRASVE